MSALPQPKAATAHFDRLCFNRAEREHSCGCSARGLALRRQHPRDVPWVAHAMTLSTERGQP